MAATLAPPCRPVHRISELSPCSWLALHVALYLTTPVIVLTAAAILAGDAVGPSLVGGIAVTSWYGPWILLPLMLALAVLRTLADLPWYWFRAATALLFALLPLLLLIAAPAAAAPVAVAHAIMAVLVVQPAARGGRSNEDPAMDRHDW